ncbi:hypothetical protein BJX63DRAFT_426125 [Aspergillus granulosus]|uniref:Transcription factor domain-containing protein n=1 Tax=Aspergillus granulosus TaxID=176169 RepID=A0ABR4GTJ5_9EURO
MNRLAKIQHPLQAELSPPSQFAAANFNAVDLLGVIAPSSSNGSSDFDDSFQLQMTSIGKVALVDTYYKDFHRFHPFKAKPAILIAAMRLIGHIYTFRKWSAVLAVLKDQIVNYWALAGPSDPVVIQARLLYSIALFWFDYKTEAKFGSDNAIHLAVGLQLCRDEFSAKYAVEDPVHAESWRRTWWMLHVIPEPKTLHNFDCLRCTASAISTAPKRAVKEDSTHIIEAADAAIDGWLFLLPKDQNRSMIGIHRFLSDLKFNPVEDASSYARELPPDNSIPELVNVHAARVMRSVEAQIWLLALPVRLFRHTPFTTCIVSDGALALLSAYHFFLKGPKLAIARDQIRMAIGCLKALAEIWPRTARNVREIQTIAQHVLGLGTAPTRSNSTPVSGDVPQLSGGGGQGSLASEGEASSNDSDLPPLPQSLDDLCGWYSIGDLGADLSWDLANGL